MSMDKPTTEGRAAGKGEPFTPTSLSHLSLTISLQTELGEDVASGAYSGRNHRTMEWGTGSPSAPRGRNMRHLLRWKPTRHSTSERPLSGLSGLDGSSDWSEVFIFVRDPGPLRCTPPWTSTVTAADTHWELSPKSLIHLVLLRPWVELLTTVWLMPSSYPFLPELDSLELFIPSLYPEEFIAQPLDCRHKIYLGLSLISRYPCHPVSRVGTLSLEEGQRTLYFNFIMYSNQQDVCWWVSLYAWPNNRIPAPKTFHFRSSRWTKNGG